MPPLETGVSQSLAKWRAANYSDVRYKLNITLEKGAPTLKGTIEIRLTVRQSDEATKRQDDPQIVLDWRKISGKEDLSTISNVSVNGQNVVLGSNLDLIILTDRRSPKYGNRFHEVKEHLVFRDRVTTGENVIKLDFTSPILTSGGAITRYVDKEDGAEYIYSLFVPSDASTAFPVFDQPDLKAKFQLNIKVPYGWKVVTNSLEEDFAATFVDENNKPVQDSLQFETTKPISTYVFAFAAGEFDEFIEGSNLPRRLFLNELSNEERHKILDKKDAQRIYVRKSQAEKFKQHSAEVFRLNREGVKFLESYFDYKFPFPKYDLVLIPEFPFGGMEHAGSTFLRETSVIFPTEPTKNDYVSRANLIFHEAAHQWFGDTVTMKWFDDLWLKEGFAEFMAYKTLEKVMPEYNAWKIFYERNKQAAYLTDSTKGTTPIYQEIPNLSSAKSAYGNIVYRKAPSFLKQAEFYLGEKEFQTAVRAFLKKHEFANAGWQDLVSEFAEVKVDEIKKREFYPILSSGDQVRLTDFTKWSVEKEWAEFWVEKRGTAVYRISPEIFEDDDPNMQWNFAPHGAHTRMNELFSQRTISEENYNWLQDVKILKVFKDGLRKEERREIGYRKYATLLDFERKNFEERRKLDQNTKNEAEPLENLESFELTEQGNKTIEEYHQEKQQKSKILYVFPNYQDYGYGIFLLDEKSRAYVLQNIQNEKDDFLRSMMWGSLWDSVREGELDPQEYVTLVIKNLNVETDESTIQTLLGRTSTAMNYYIDLGFGNADFGLKDKQTANPESRIPNPKSDGSDLQAKLEDLLIEKMQNAQTTGQKITFYRAFLNTASSEKARNVLKQILKRNAVILDGNERESAKTPAMKTPDAVKMTAFQLKTKDKFDIVTRLLILGDKDAPQILADLEKTETSDEAKRYAYAAKAGIASAENKAKFWNDFVNNKEISESWIEAAFAVFNSPKHSELTLPYLEKALAELPNLKRNRKIFFVNGWLSSFIGGQKSEEALKIVNEFLRKNPNLDKDLRLKILENSDTLERAVKIRAKFN